MYEQRPPEMPAPASAEADGAPWSPTEEAYGENRRPPAPGDRYVAVDRIDGNVVTLATAPWPTVDPVTARLDFGPRNDRSVVTVMLESLQRRVDRDRAAAEGQVVRPIRAGDAFLVSGYTPNLDSWASVVDVTRSARMAAKAAILATAAPAPTVEELEAYGLDRTVVEETTTPEPSEEPPPEQPPPGPVAFPAV